MNINEGLSKIANNKRFMFLMIVLTVLWIIDAILLYRIVDPLASIFSWILAGVCVGLAYADYAFRVFITSYLIPYNENMAAYVSGRVVGVIQKLKDSDYPMESLFKNSETPKVH
jgi:hypothetical protein